MSGDNGMGTKIGGSGLVGAAVPNLFLLAVFGCLSAADAGAQQTQPYAAPSGSGQPYVGADLMAGYDSNVTRQAGGTPVVGSEFDRASLLAGFDHTYDRERVYALADVGRETYRSESLYDYTTQQWRLGVQANLPRDFSADLALSRSVQLAHQEDFSTIQRDVIAQDGVDSWFRFPLATEWHGVLGASASELRNSNGLDVPTDLNTVQFEAGLRYQTGSENYVDLLGRSEQATYPQGSAASLYDLTSYHERGADIRIRWRFSGSSQLLGRAGYVERRNEILTIRNFSGPAYDLTYVWTPGSKIRLEVYGLRATGEPGDNDYLSAVTHTLRLAPSYRPTENIRLESFALWSRIDFVSDLSAIQENLAPATSRSDRLSSYGLAADWTPLRWLELKLSAHFDDRTSTVPIWSYVDRVTMLEVRTKF